MDWKKEGNGNKSRIERKKEMEIRVGLKEEYIGKSGRNYSAVDQIGS